MRSESLAHAAQSPRLVSNIPRVWLYLGSVTLRLLNYLVVLFRGTAEMIRTIYLRTISLLLSNALVAKSKSPLLVRSQTMSDAGRGFTDIRRLTQATVALVEGILFLRFIIPDHRTAVDRRLPMIAQGSQEG